MTRPNISKCLLLIAWICFTLMPTTAQAQASTVNIGAWNIQYLGSAGCRSANHAQEAEEIANFIIASGVDVLGLEEITDDDGIASTYSNKTLTKAMQIIRQKTGHIWRHELFRKFQGDPTGCKARNVQMVGVAWNASKAKNQGAIKISMKPPNHMPVWNRHPYAVKFSFGANKTDVVVIVVHMKSNVPTEGGPDTAVQRQWEAKLLTQRLVWVKAHFRDQDIIILGDTNVLGSQEEAINRFVGAGFTDLNSQDRDTSTRENEPFDRIFLTAGQPEFANSRQEVFGPNYLNYDTNEFVKRLSDHYLVKTSITVSADDDH